jgi:hypothetical protein
MNSPSWKVAAVGGALLGFGIGAVGVAQADDDGRPRVERVQLRESSTASPDVSAAPTSVRPVAPSPDTTVDSPAPPTTAAPTTAATVPPPPPAPAPPPPPAAAPAPAVPAASSASPASVDSPASPASADSDDSD